MRSHLKFSHSQLCDRAATQNNLFQKARSRLKFGKILIAVITSKIKCMLLVAEFCGNFVKHMQIPVMRFMIGIGLQLKQNEKT